MSIEKSERKTLFLSLLDGTQEELDALQEVLEQTDLPDDYRVIASPKPIQTMDPRELVKSLEDIYGNVDDHNGVDRWAKVVRSMFHTQEALQGIKKELMAFNENFIHLETSLNNISAATGAGNGFARLQSYGSTELQIALDHLKQYIPKEGEKW